MFWTMFKDIKTDDKDTRSPLNYRRPDPLTCFLAQAAKNMVGKMAVGYDHVGPGQVGVDTFA